jgi:NAD(P)-dependent dehydrogenase (short-subunit alcohol dehydrogenase family)
MTGGRGTPMRTDFEIPFLDRDRAPTAGEIGIAFRQGPQAVHVVGTYDPGVDVKGRAGAHPPDRFRQRFDLCDQQVRPAIEQVRREEEGSARNPIATIIRHDGSMPGVGERRKALRFFRPTRGETDREETMAGLLEGKSALITGGGGGIGRATALAFAREGARLAVADYAADMAAETVALVNAAGGQAITLTGDVTRAKDVKTMLDDTIVAYGRLDCAFNNAGIAGWQVEAAGKKTAEWSEAAFDRMIAVNLKGVWLCMKHELTQMQAQGGGAIVNTASIAGLAGLPTSSAYVAAKHGVIGLTKTAAIEYAEAGIRVNAVCPGYIQTRMTEETMRRRGAAILAQTPLGRMGNPEEIAEMVVWLCSDRASYVTGAAYNVDGGWMAV